MSVLYTPWNSNISWEEIQFQSLFYCANKSYTSDLKLKLLRGRNEHFKKIRATLWLP